LEFSYRFKSSKTIKGSISENFFSLITKQFLISSLSEKYPPIEYLYFKIVFTCFSEKPSFCHSSADNLFGSKFSREYSNEFVEVLALASRRSRHIPYSCTSATSCTDAFRF